MGITAINEIRKCLISQHISIRSSQCFIPGIAGKTCMEFIVAWNEFSFYETKNANRKQNANIFRTYQYFRFGLSALIYMHFSKLWNVSDTSLQFNFQPHVSNEKNCTSCTS